MINVLSPHIQHNDVFEQLFLEVHHQTPIVFLNWHNLHIKRASMQKDTHIYVSKTTKLLQASQVANKFGLVYAVAHFS